MKKMILGALVCFFCFPVFVHASSIGDPETVGGGKFAVGVDQEFVFHRDLEPKSGPTDVSEEVKWLYRTMAKASYGIFDFMDIYVKLGASKYKMENDVGGLGILKFDTKGRVAFAYGGGVKMAFPFKSGLLVGADMQYLRQRHNTETDFFGADLDGKDTIQEWHVAPFVGMKLGSFIPYAGVRYSDMRMKSTLEGFGDAFKFKADDNFGAFVGTTYKINKNFNLNVEGRFIDETAVSIGLTYKFN